MTIGMRTINKIRDVEKVANQCGFELRFPSDTNRQHDVIALFPINDSYPLYWRKELFVGTLTEVEMYLKGLVWMKEYLIQIKAVTPEHIAKKEQSIRNKKLIKTLKE